MFILSPRRRGQSAFFLFIQKSNPDLQQCHQIFTGKKPFADLPNFHAIAKVAVEINLRGHQRLVKPGNMSAELWAILQRCLARDPMLRPTMATVVAELASESLSV